MDGRIRGVCLAAVVAVCARSAAADEMGWSAPTEPMVAQAAEESESLAGSRKGRTLLEEVVVEAQKPLSSASSDVIRAKDYDVRPHDTLLEILNNTPGLVVSQHQGGGKAPQYFIRGFDSDHGTDFALFFEGLPVNLPTNAHGQGYADVNFIIPETVDRLQLYKGPYFAQFGDFATAGALNFVTKDEFPQPFAYASGGFFSTQRYVLGGSVPLDWAKNMVAAQVYYTDGPFENPQHYLTYTGYGKFAFDPTPESKLTMSTALYYGTWNGSGQIPARAVDAGFIYTNPTALVPDPGTQPFNQFSAIDPMEGGKTDREFLQFLYEYTPTAEETWTVQGYGSHYSLELFSDFSFFQDSGLRFSKQGNTITDNHGMADPDPTLNYIPGDGIDQSEDRWIWGGLASYTRDWFAWNIPIRSQVAFQTRNDYIGNLALYRQIQRNRFFTVNLVGVQESSVSGYTDQQIFFNDWIRLDLGLRGDLYYFDVGNKQPSSAFNPNNDPNFTAVYINGNSSSDGIVSPKANLVVTPLPSTDVYFNFGTGFHSNDARGVILSKTNPSQSNGNITPLVRAIGGELGSRTRQFDSLDLAASLWLLDLDSELVFVGDGGDVELSESGSYAPRGATRRWGVDFEARYQVLDWLFLDYDLTWDDPRFRATGEAIPLAPTLLQNGGITTRFANGFEAALRVRNLGSRPANEDRTLTAEGYTLVDLLGKYRWKNVEFELAFLNITDTDWRQAQFANTTCLVGDEGSANCPATPGKGPVEGIDGINFTPGNPFNVRGGVSVYF